MAPTQDPTPDQLASQIQMSRTHVSKLVAAGDLPTYEDAGVARVRPEHVAAFVAQRAADRAELTDRFANAGAARAALLDEFVSSGRA